MITDQEIQQFSEMGAVTIDTPLTQQQLRTVSAVFDRLLPFCEPEAGEKPRYRVSTTCTFYDQELLDIIQHPFFEEVAKRVLRADEVSFFQTAIVTTYPAVNTPFSFDQHVDIQYCLSDLDATPRRMVCTYFLWIDDVTAQRAPLMYRPGSHRLIAKKRGNQPELKGIAPLVAGVSLAGLPTLDYADAIPVVARAGQASVLTTGMVHGASINVDTVPRKTMVITFTATEVEIDLPQNQAETKRAYDRELKRRLRPERAHIVPA
jgi:ectoine hydroxylase-related dioxygenase (phytanoyl-CoA dioxygenase family)